MKSLFRIVRRYMGLAVLIGFLILFLNIMLYGKFITDYAQKYGKNYSYCSDLEMISRELSPEGGALGLGEEGLAVLEDRYVFAMQLSEEGEVIWSHDLPETLMRKYSLSDVAVMSRWYLEDYPVYVWKNAYGLLVLGREQGSEGKYRMELSEDQILLFIRSVVFLFVVNTVLILVLCFVLGWRFYRTIRPLGEGIEQLSLRKRVSLPEIGITADLASQLNATSGILEEQSLALAKRDQARTEWISGVSHDIRTPLSMIMGYADTLERDERLPAGERQKAGIIREQSVVIKELVEDLNLASRLEYRMQPLRMEEVCLAALLRRLAAEYYNRLSAPENVPEDGACGGADAGLEAPPGDTDWEIQVDIDKAAEGKQMKGDARLLERAFSNLIGNSIRHNPGGVIFIRLKALPDGFQVVYGDGGKGISSEVLKALRGEEKEAGQVHVMGLKIVRQVVLAHQGSIEFMKEDGRRNRIRIYLPYHPQLLKGDSPSR